MIPRAPRSRTLPAVLVLLASSTIAGCGADGEDPPALCARVADLRTSIEAVSDVELDRGALDALQDQLETIQSDLGEVADEASDEYSDEVDGLEQAASDLGGSLQDAVATPSGQGLEAVGTAIGALRTSLTTLTDSVEETC